MVQVKNTWVRFKSSRFGWAFLVTLFSLLFGVLAVALSGLLGLSWLLGDNSANADVALGLIFPIVVLLLSVLVAAYLSRTRDVSLFELLGWKLPKKNAFWLVPLALLVYVILLVISLSILQMLSPELADQKQEVATTVRSLGSWRLLAMVISVGIVTPVAEETFFRGLLMSFYSKRLRFPLAILLSATLFALAHGQVNIGIDTLFFGLVLGFLAWKTESIYPSIGLHMLKNCLALSVILS